MTKIVGLTGGIGSGKTTVAQMFKSLGVPVYNSDEEAKLLMQSSDVIKEELIQLLGENCYKNGQLNRSFIASKVFEDAVEETSLPLVIATWDVKNATC